MFSKNTCIVASLLLFVLFLIYSSQIDQYVSTLPLNVISNRFYGDDNYWVRFIYNSISWLTAALVIFPIFLLIISKTLHIGNFKKIRQFTVIILVSLALGPGLLINKVLKDNWGRPRPYQVIHDAKPFSPFWQSHFGATSDNSFPSGHASIGFFLGVPFLALGYRRRGLLVSIIAGSFIGMVRVLQGGHYVSDIIFSGIFVWLVGELVVAIVYALD